MKGKKWMALALAIIVMFALPFWFTTSNVPVPSTDDTCYDCGDLPGGDNSGGDNSTQVDTPNNCAHLLEVAKHGKGHHFGIHKWCD